MCYYQSHQLWKSAPTPHAAENSSCRFVSKPISSAHPSALAASHFHTVLPRKQSSAGGGGGSEDHSFLTEWKLKCSVTLTFPFLPKSSEFRPLPPGSSSEGAGIKVLEEKEGKGKGNRARAGSDEWNEHKEGRKPHGQINRRSDSDGEQH